MAKTKIKKETYSKGKPTKNTSDIYAPDTHVQDYIATEVINEDGTIDLVNVPFDSSKLDLGTWDMYNLEEMLAAGITPASIHTSGNNKVAFEGKIDAALADLDNRLTQENNTTTTND